MKENWLMSPQTTGKGRGHLRFDRHFRGVGRVRVTAQTSNLIEFRKRDRILDRLFEAGQLDVLRMLQRGEISASELRQAQRDGQLASDSLAFNPAVPIPAPGRRRLTRSPCRVYVMHRADTNEYKIGKSRDPVARLRALQTASGAPLTLEAHFVGGADAELALHRRFAPHRKVGEWFLAAPEIVEWLAGIRRR